MEVTFENNYKACLIYNAKTKENIVSLYSPEGMYLSSMPCLVKDFQTVGKALMYGYFAGWSDCKRIMTKEIISSCEVEMIK